MRGLQHASPGRAVLSNPIERTVREDEDHLAGRRPRLSAVCARVRRRRPLAGLLALHNSRLVAADVRTSAAATSLARVVIFARNACSLGWLCRAGLQAT